MLVYVTWIDRGELVTPSDDPEQDQTPPRPEQTLRLLAGLSMKARIRRLPTR